MDTIAILYAIFGLLGGAILILLAILTYTDLMARADSLWLMEKLAYAATIVGIVGIIFIVFGIYNVITVIT